MAEFRVLKPKVTQVVATSPVLETLDEDAATSVITRRQSRDWADYLPVIYFLGLSLLLARLAIGTVRARAIIRQAVPHDGLRSSGACLTPFTTGWLRPAVILPEDWPEWSPAKLNAVLAHEGEHASRRDPLVQWLALLNRAIFWFHPLAWWLEQRLSVLAEEACDDAVLAGGHDPLEYSEHLLSLARSVQRRGARIGVAGMAMPGVSLPGRIRRIVAGVPLGRISGGRLICLVAACSAAATVFTAGNIGYAQNESRPSPRNTATAVQTNAAPDAAGTPDLAEAQAPLGTSLPLGKDKATSASEAPLLRWAPSWQGQQGKATSFRINSSHDGVILAQVTTSRQPTDGFGAAYQTLSGTVVDPSNAIVPNAQVILKRADGSITSTVTTNSAGIYLFQNIPPGVYSVTVSALGFKRQIQTDISLAAGETRAFGRTLLQLGNVQESMTVQGSRSMPVAAAAPPSQAAERNQFVDQFWLRRDARPAPADSGPGGPIRVGGNVQAANLINAIKPVYPVDLQQQGISGTVKIEGVISKDGLLGISQVVSQIDPHLTQLALDAVTQWRYRPTLLNGEPVETITVIDVNFTLTD